MIFSVILLLAQFLFFAVVYDPFIPAVSLSADIDAALSAFSLIPGIRIEDNVIF